MKKLTAILLSVTILALSLALTGCKNDDVFMAKAYSSQDKMIESISIDVYDREISVSVSEDNEFHIDYFESEKEYYKITVSNDNALTMKLLKNVEWTDFIPIMPPKEYRQISLKIPNSLLANLTIVTTNETIKLSALTITSNITLSSSGGSLEFKQINAGQGLSLTAKDGDIKGTIIGSYDMFSIACKIKKGTCNLPLEKLDGEKSLKVDCNNGDIKIAFVK